MSKSSSVSPNASALTGAEDAERAILRGLGLQHDDADATKLVGDWITALPAACP